MKKQELFIPNEILGSVVLKLIELVGYHLLTQGINKKGSASYVKWRLVKDETYHKFHCKCCN